MLDMFGTGAKFCFDSGGRHLGGWDVREVDRRHDNALDQYGRCYPDAVDDDKHQTELFMLRENAGPIFVDESPEEIRTVMDIELERLSQIAKWTMGGPRG
ncbi:hypothetical protein FHX10_006994 [Rhizobium sp. BK591]|uniref:hypothetical protein n=1 Tax=Rhizobium sp. BK591 TaxID=2586985 RepID=UPI00182F6BE3|nr:hypothetical protein [Rhizobium sp. BK591]MBB3747437.1 hypothetical protein [Rhizobium sp. BK591]